MKNLFYKIAEVIITLIFSAGIVMVFAGACLADSSSMIPTLVCVGGGFAAMGMSVLIAGAVL